MMNRSSHVTVIHLIFSFFSPVSESRIEPQFRSEFRTESNQYWSCVFELPCDVLKYVAGVVFCCCVFCFTATNQKLCPHLGIRFYFSLKYVLLFSCCFSVLDFLKKKHNLYFPPPIFCSFFLFFHFQRLLASTASSLHADPACFSSFYFFNLFIVSTKIDL